MIRRLDYSLRVALLTTLVLGFCTPLWVYSKRYYGEPLTTLFVVATLYFALVAARRTHPIPLIFTGLAFGAAVAAKYINGPLLLPVVFYIGFVALRNARSGHLARDQVITSGASHGLALSRSAVAASFQALGWFGIGVAPFAALVVQYNLARFGSPLATGYGPTEVFSTPLWEGLGACSSHQGEVSLSTRPCFFSYHFGRRHLSGVSRRSAC